jgi:hypothetical protein
VRRTHPAAVLVAVTSLCLAACGGGDDSPDASGTESPTPPSTWPMTGLPVPDDKTAEQPYPVLVTKLDNTASSAPQLGLGKADLVVEELVEGGLTRLAAFYYSRLPTRVGPVRSMRASDIGIVAPVDASIVTSGAAPQTIARIEDAGITYYPEGSDGITRDSSRAAPYNVFADLTTIALTGEQDETRPSDYLPWSAEDDLPEGKPATRVTASFGAGHTTIWTVDGGRYVNENAYAEDGDAFPADTVLVLRVKIVDAGYVDPAGNPVPETKLTGTGDAMIFHAGRMVRGTWQKESLDAPITLSAKTGDLSVPAGHVWIELVPTSTGEVTFGT